MFYHGAFGGFAQTGADMRFDLGFQPPSAVPVELTAFDAVADGDEVVLAWETASETNNAGFDVELLSAGADWQRLAFVEGHGTTAAPQRYAHRIGGLAAGTYRFRLRQVDLDGAATHLPEVEVSLALAGTHTLAVWPNPMVADGQVRLQVMREQVVSVTLHDALGRRVAVLFGGTASAEAPVEARLPGGLSAGLYIVRAQGERFSETTRVTVAR